MKKNKYIVVCKYNNYSEWDICNPNDEFDWIINNNTVPDVLYNEDNKFDCIRYKIYANRWSIYYLINILDWFNHYKCLRIKI